MNKTVILPYDPTWAAREWAKTHCPSYITNQSIPRGALQFLPNFESIIQIEYVFGDERDALAFTLRWV